MESQLGKELFGTDGIRGVAGRYPLDPATVYAFGLALGDDVNAAGSAPEILIGADTRESGRSELDRKSTRLNSSH